MKLFRNIKGIIWLAISTGKVAASPLRKIGTALV